MTAGAALALAAVTLAATVLVTTTGPVEPVAALPQQHAVRTWSQTWVDAGRTACRAGSCGPRTLVTHVWAPTDGGGYPIVVFAHGFAVAPPYYDVFLRAVASAGYVIVAPELPEATSNGPCCPDRLFTAAQAGDVSFVLSRVLAEAAAPGSAFAGLVTTVNPTVVGHSDGGMVAAALLSSDVADSRFAGGVVIAAAVDHAVSGWGPHRPNVLVVHGDADSIESIGHDQEVYDDSAGPKAFLAGAGRSHSGVILDPDADGGRQAIVGWLDWTSRGDVNGLGRFRSWGTSTGWYLRGSWGLSFDPVGALEVVTPATLQVSASGWALDPDTVFPLYVDLWVDGAKTTVVADRDRPELGAFWGNGDHHGFAATVPATAGPHHVCAWAHNVGAGGNVEVGCQDVVVAAPSPPAAPTGLTARGYHGSAALWWSPNAATDQVSGYRVTCSCGTSKVVTTTSTSFAGLADGSAATFTIRAVNAAGDGPPATVVVTPADLAAGLVPVAPTRVLDTRPTASALGPRSVGHLPLSPPVGAIGAVLSVTAVGPTAPTYLAVAPTHEAPGDVSSLNTEPGIGPVSNQLVVPLGADGGVDVYNNSGSVDVVVDLMGWMTTSGGLRRQDATPTRLLDTRTGAAVGPGATVDVTVGHPGAAVGLVITSTAATADSFLTAWGPGARPLASIQNPRPGLDRAANVIVPVDASGTVHIYNNSGTTHLVVDLVGAYDATGTRWHAQAPWRLYDSRVADGPLVANTARLLPTTTPLQANVVATEVSATGFVTAWGSGAWPGTSNLNVGAGRTIAQQVVAGSATGLQVRANVATQVVVDVTGEWR